LLRLSTKASALQKSVNGDPEISVDGFIMEDQDMGVTGQDDWEDVWDARAYALALVLGPGHDQVFHAPHPYPLGGQADVLAFFHSLDGVIYVTAELIGVRKATHLRGGRMDRALRLSGFARPKYG
jgi:hypothetical protein